MVLAGAVLGTAVGATLGFPAGPLWGLGGLLAGAALGALVGPFLFIFLGMLATPGATGCGTPWVCCASFGARAPDASWDGSRSSASRRSR